MNRNGERKIDPRQAAQKLSETGLLSEKEAVAYVYFHIIDDPQKQAKDIFHISESELQAQKGRADQMVEAAKKAMRVKNRGTRLKDKANILVGCGLGTEHQAEAYSNYGQVGDETVSKMLDRPIKDIQHDFEAAKTKIEQAEEVYQWLIEHTGIEKY